MGRLPAGTGPEILLIDASQPKRVYAADQTGLYRSEDAGWTWQQADDGLPPGGVAAVTLDPRQPERVYALARGGGLYTSADGASSWAALRGAEASGGT